MTRTPQELHALRDVLALYGVAVTQVSASTGEPMTITVSRVPVDAVRHMTSDLICGITRTHITPGAVMWSETYHRVVEVVYPAGMRLTVRPYGDLDSCMHVPPGDLRPVTHQQLDEDRSAGVAP